MNDISQISQVCQSCCKPDKTTMRRSFRLKQYEGPCGDSFCYASCESLTCRPFEATICNTCAERLQKR